MAPSEVIVMVEPISSSRVAVPAPRRLGEPVHLRRATPQIARLGVPHHGHHKARWRLRRDADMHAGMLMQDTRFVVEMRIQAGLLRDSAHHRAHQEGQQGQPRLVRALPSVQRRPKLFERSDVDLLNVGDVRDARVGDRHLLGDLAAQADHLDVFNGCLRLIALATVAVAGP